jgi:site-specific recombinase XerC
MRRAAGRPLAFDAAGAEDYKAHLVSVRCMSQVSVSTYLTALRRFGQYLVAAGLLSENPARDLGGNRRPDTHSREMLRRDEVGQLIESLPAESLIDLRDRALVGMMLFAGLSEVEIVRADIVDLENQLMGWFLRVQGKGRTSKDQQVVLEPEASAPTEAYLRARGVGARSPEPLFTGHGRRGSGERMNTRSVRARVAARLQAAGLRRPGISAHSLTHTAALIWLSQGHPVEEVRRRMRHGTLETTMIYWRRQWV